VRRRDFITLAGGMAVWPLAARAQQSMPVIGFVAATTLTQAGKYLANVREGLAEYGYVEGKNSRLSRERPTTRTTFFQSSTENWWTKRSV